jgi:DNA helicase IV
MIAAEKEKFEKDFKNGKDKLSEEQVQQLMSAHAENMEMLSRNINVEKDRQLNSLASKIAERRKMKAAILARKHEAAVAKELVKQREERSEVKNDHVSRTEVEMFFKPINVIPPYLSTLAMSIMNSFRAIEIQTDPIYSMRSFNEFFDYYHAVLGWCSYISTE